MSGGQLINRALLFFFAMFATIFTWSELKPAPVVGVPAEHVTLPAANGDVYVVHDVLVCEHVQVKCSSEKDETRCWCDDDGAQ